MAQYTQKLYSKLFFNLIAEDDDSESVFVMLNGEESELVFTYVTNIKVSREKGKVLQQQKGSAL